MTIIWDDETCLIFAQAYDGEDAALIGETKPHNEKGAGYAEWAAERIACVRAGIGAVARPTSPIAWRWHWNGQAIVDRAVAAAYEAAAGVADNRAKICRDAARKGVGAEEIHCAIEAEHIAAAIRALTPADATASLTQADLDKAVGEAIEAALKVCLAVRNHPATPGREALGAMECAFDIQMLHTDATRAAIRKGAKP